jgi:opacity protein-like surface antigen
MNRSLKQLSLIGSAFVLTTITASTSFGQKGGFYVKGDLGGNVTEDTDLKEYFGPVTPGSKVKFDPGLRFGVAAGYWVTDWFATEGETGIMANTIHSITEAERADAVFSNIPFLANVRFQIPHARFSPYIGGGAGGTASILDVDRITINGLSTDGSDGDTVFAYQGFAGFKYQINERMWAGVEYRYFVADEAEWRAEFGFGTESDQLRFGRSKTHSLSLTFSYTF